MTMTNAKPRQIEPITDKKFFLIQKWSGRFIGIWPLDKQRPTILLSLNIFALISTIVGGAAYGIINFNHLKLSIDTIAPASTEALALYKILFLFYDRTKHCAILEQLHGYFKDEKKIPHMLMYERATQYGHWISRTLVTLSGVTGVLYVLRPIITNIYQYLSDQPIVRELPFHVASPIDVYHSHLYFIVYFLFSEACFNTVASLGATDSMFLVICIHLSLQFDLCKYDIDNLWQNEIGRINIFPSILWLKSAVKSRIIFAEYWSAILSWFNYSFHSAKHKLTAADNQKIHKCLAKVVRKQEELFSLHESVVQLWTPIMFVHFITSAVLICFVSINLIMSTGVDTMVYTNYILAILMQLLIYAISGDRIATSSCSIADAIYSFQWTTCNRNVQRMTILMIARSQKDTKVVVPFFEISLQAFGKILQSAVSYITLMNQFI